MKRLPEAKVMPRMMAERGFGEFKVHVNGGFYSAKSRPAASRMRRYFARFGGNTDLVGIFYRARHNSRKVGIAYTGKIPQ